MSKTCNECEFNHLTAEQCMEGGLCRGRASMLMAQLAVARATIAAAGKLAKNKVFRTPVKMELRKLLLGED